ncbi:hypothetical protein, partial [Enterobacter asburiae]|uniref:hypothetical protein n=3 Tax=Enterobacter asburiae TaxID=61645 RepID=UPI001F14F253
MAGFLLFCVYKSLLCILVSLCRGIVRSALPDGGFALSGLLSPQARQVQHYRPFLRAQSKKPRTLRYGVLLFDAWQFPTLTWGDPTLPSALR